MVSNLNTLPTVLDNLAPEKQIHKLLGPKHPWYNSELRSHERKVHELEKKWLRYKLDSLWIACKNAWNSYYARLNTTKKLTLRNKIRDCNGDSKQLYKLVTNLTTKSVRNPLPPAKSDKELANSFASFFKDKILTTGQLFLDIPQYRSEALDVPKLRRFHPMMEEQVELMVKQMKTKSCKSDLIPTEILKQMLPVLKLAITKVVNLSLSQGYFHEEWKTAIVCPLLKKIGLQLTNSNYRPVSNLTFISKLIEKCMWDQLNRHCLTYKLQPDY